MLGEGGLWAPGRWEREPSTQAVGSQKRLVPISVPDSWVLCRKFGWAFHPCHLHPGHLLSLPSGPLESSVAILDQVHCQHLLPITASHLKSALAAQRTPLGTAREGTLPSLPSFHIPVARDKQAVTVRLCSESLTLITRVT